MAKASMKTEDQNNKEVFRIDRLVSFVEKIFFYIQIAIIPTHFFWILPVDWPLWNGLVLDYWLPKAWMAQLLTLALLTIILIRMAFFKRSPQNPYFRPISLPWLLCGGALTAFLLIHSLLSAFPLIAFGSLSSTLLGPALFAWLWWQRSSDWQKWLPGAVLVSGSIQILMAIYQLIFKSSLGGYWLLGSRAAPSDWLPFGSTAHPNVLAGWLVATWLAGLIIMKSRPHNIDFILFTILFYLLMVMTGSWAGLLTLTWLVVITSFPLVKKWLLGGGIWLTVLTGVSIMPGIWLLDQTETITLNPSIARRSEQFAQVVGQLWQKPGGNGVGQHLNWLVPQQTSQSGWRLPQPAHSGPWVLVGDYGLWTTFLFLFFTIVVHFYYTAKKGVLILSLPFLYLDHWFLSLISGQYMLIVIAVLFVIACDFEVSNK